MVTDETPASAPKMSTRDVSVFYGEKKAVDGVTIDIPQEFVTAFIGPSGCGKSTFLRALNRMNDTIASAQLHHVHAAGVDILAVELDASVHPGRSDGVVHAVERAQEGRLAAARGADEGGDLVAADVHRDALERLELPVVEVELVGPEDHHVLPLALPGMLTGTIIGMARALGETAPLLMIGMRAFVATPPDGFTDPATVLPVQIFLWSDEIDRGFVERTSAAIIVLLLFLLIMNGLAIYLRNRFEKTW